MDDASSQEIVQESIPSTSKSVPTNSGAFPTPEYASIDKIKKGLSIKRKPADAQCKYMYTAQYSRIIFGNAFFIANMGLRP